MFSGEDSKKIGSLKNSLEELFSGWSKFINLSPKNDIISRIDPPMHILSPDKINSNENQDHCITPEVEPELFQTTFNDNFKYKHGDELKQKLVDTDIGKKECYTNEASRSSDRSSLEKLDSINKEVTEEDPAFDSRIIIEERIIKKYTPYTTKHTITTVSNDDWVLLHFEDELDTDEDNTPAPICEDGNMEISFTQAQIQHDQYIIPVQSVINRKDENIRIIKPSVKTKKKKVPTATLR